MLSTSEIEAAWEESERILGQADSDWISGSALRERAYRIGVFAGLSAVASHEARAILDSLAGRSVLRTLFARREDDKFWNTHVREAFEAFKAALVFERPAAPTSGPEALALRAIVQQLRADKEYHATRALELLDPGGNERWVEDLTSQLEKHLRAFATTL